MAGEVHSLFDLSGCVAMVTGGGSGLGREFCNVLAEFGADIVCPDLNKDWAEETCEMIKEYGHKTFAIEADVSKYDHVQEVFKKVEESFGRLDILVNNAGITAPYLVIDQINIDDWHKVINVNLHGVFYCMKEGFRIMIKQKKGSIINIASIAGIGAVDPDIMASAHYVASKSAVIGLTKQGAAEYSQHGIRVNCIAPGWHGGTKLSESAGIRRTEEEKRISEEMIAERIPMKRRGRPKELKSLLLYLASDSSSYMTGQIIAHDGGWTCW